MMALYIRFLFSFHPETAFVPFRGVAKLNVDFTLLAKSIAQAIDFDSTSLCCVSAHQKLAFLDEHYLQSHVHV